MGPKLGAGGWHPQEIPTPPLGAGKRVGTKRTTNATPEAEMRARTHRREQGEKSHQTALSGGPRYERLNPAKRPGLGKKKGIINGPKKQQLKLGQEVEKAQSRKKEERANVTDTHRVAEPTNPCGEGTKVREGVFGKKGKKQSGVSERSRTYGG